MEWLWTDTVSPLSMAKTRDIAAPFNTQRNRPGSRSVENECYYQVYYAICVNNGQEFVKMLHLVI